MSELAVRYLLKELEEIAELSILATADPRKLLALLWNAETAFIVEECLSTDWGC